MKDRVDVIRRAAHRALRSSGAGPSESRRAATNTSWALTAHLTGFGVQGLTFVLIARSLGVSDFGAFAAAVALAGILAPLVGWGAGNILIRDVARDPSTLPVRYGNALLMIAGSSIVLIAALATVGRLAFANLPMSLFFVVGLSELFFARLNLTAAQVYQALERMRPMALLRTSLYLFRLAAVTGVLLVLPAPRPVDIAVAYLAASSLSALLASLQLRPIVGIPSLRLSLIGRNLRVGVSFALGLTSHEIDQNVDKSMLARLAGLEAAGVYAAAYRVISLAFAPVLALLNATYARFFRDGASRPANCYDLARRLTVPAAAYSIAAGIAILLFAPVVPSLLGDDYGAAVAALRWLALVPFLQSLYFMAGNALTGAGFQRTRMFVEVSVAALNIVLNLALIPVFSWRGAAWATLLCEATLAVTLWIILILRTRTPPLLYESVARRTTAPSAGTPWFRAARQAAPDRQLVPIADDQDVT